MQAACRENVADQLAPPTFARQTPGILAFERSGEGCTMFSRAADWMHRE